MMAMEAVKALTGAGEGLRGRLMIYDGLFAQVRIIAVERRADCAVCGGASVRAGRMPRSGGRAAAPLAAAPAPAPDSDPAPNPDPGAGARPDPAAGPSAD